MTIVFFAGNTSHLLPNTESQDLWQPRIPSDIAALNLTTSFWDSVEKPIICLVSLVTGPRLKVMEFLSLASPTARFKAENTANDKLIGCSIALKSHVSC